MADEVRVWIKTSTLDKIVFGKAHTSSQRQSIATAVSGDADPNVVNWGWARGRIVSANEGGGGGGGGGGSAEDALTSSSDHVQVYVEDGESEHNRTAVDVPRSEVKDGNVVMANSYGGGDEDDFTGGGGGGGGDDGFDDDDGGGGFGSRKGKGCAYPPDLITLTHLHEPAVVYCLRRRYDYDEIYTSTGPILIALNPFKNCKTLYSEAVMKRYYNRGERLMLSSGSTSAVGSSAEDGDEEEEKKAEAPAEEMAGDDGEEELDPHVYGIADHSFRSMMNSLEEKNSAAGGGSGSRRRTPGSGRADSSTKSSNQAILVSGESGAGKTVTTKFIMQYLATLSRRSARQTLTKTPSGRDVVSGGAKVNIEQQVLQSNPILESFGNARTVRNDNSSRFGKFIEIQFTASGSLVGASIQTYLLEKVRLITQAEGERNYHIFFEMLSGMDETDLDRYHLGEYNAEDFRMTCSESNTYDRRDGVEDSETYQDLMDAMDTMGFADGEKADILAVTAAQLHSSNLTLNSLSADESEIDKDNVHLDPVLELMGFTADDLNRALCYFSIQAGKEKHVRSLPKQKAAKGLEALIKATYGALFDYIVQRINSSITVKDGGKRRGGGGSRGAAGGGGMAATIGVLDIFGFESFKKNSFEQLCINYCNEALQQQFNLFVLKNEQEEYEREGIKWSFIAFPENQDVLDLIGKKGSGIIPILDDQCRAPGTTDKTFANDIYKKCTDNARFEANFRQVGALCFGINHYAGPVEYDTEGFVEKNRDELPKEASELLLSSTNDFVKKLAGILSGPSPDAASGSGAKAARSAGKRVTVGGQFSQQLADLRSKIDLTSPHYVRCLKPNDMLVPDHFDPVIVADQLRCAGVVEAVRVSRVGYPQRYSHSLFVNRYRILGSKELKKAARSSRRQKPVEVLVNAIAAKIAETEDRTGAKEEEEKEGGEPIDLLVSVGIQVGKTKVFLRRKAYDMIERLRSNEMRRAAIRVQAVGRRYIAMKEYDEALLATVKLQCFVRRVLAAKKVDVMRRNYNATVIQTAYRRMVARYSFVSVVAVVSWAQRMQRGHTGRAKYESLNRERKAIVVQKYSRAHCSSKAFGTKKKSALTIQCALRCHRARQALKDLRAQARDLSATANERDVLRQETQTLRQELEKAKALAKKEAERAAEAAVALEGASSKGADEADELRQETERLRSELEEMRDKAMEYSGRASEALASANASSEELDSVLRENEELKKQLDGLTITSEEKAKEFAIITDEMDKLKIELERAKDVRKENEELKQQVDGFAAASGENEREEMEELKTELKEARELAAEEITTLKTELEEARESAALAAAADADAATPQSVPVGASDEVDKFQERVNVLMKDLDGANEASKSSFEELETLRSENARLQDSLHAARRAPGGNSDVTMTSSDELVSAMEEIQDLKQRLQEAEKKDADKGERAIAAPAAAPKQMPRIPEDSEPDERAMEILTLQDEVERLNKELAEVKEADADTFDHNSSESLIRRYEELSRLSNALVEKDRDMEELKREVQNMKAEVKEGVDISAKDSSTSHTEESDGGTMSTLQNPGNSSLENPGQGDRSKKDVNMALTAYKDEVMALREINEILRSDVEQSRKACEEAKFELREETRRSAKELEAFAETLKGVDELRAAAEAMSREITKNRKYYMSDDGGALMAASSVAGATKRLSSMEKQEETGNLWTRMTGGMTGGMTGDSSRNLETQSPPSNEDRQKSSRRRRRRKQDEESVISAFF